MLGLHPLCPSFFVSHYAKKSYKSVNLGILSNYFYFFAIDHSLYNIMLANCKSVRCTLLHLVMVHIFSFVIKKLFYEVLDWVVSKTLK